MLTQMKVFLIDNANTMEQYRDKVRDVLELLTYITIMHDPNGIDLYFSNSSDKRRPKTNADVLKKFDKTPPPKSDFLDFKVVFNNIIGEYQRQLGKKHLLRSWFSSHPEIGPRKLSLYVLTDGVWQSECDLSITIKTLVAKLKEHGLVHDQVGIQFIRFGNDSREGGRLQFLDSGLETDL